MGLKKTQDPTINPRAPWDNDDLNREREGVLLTRLIQSLTGSYVIALKGGWGTGKSVFLRRLSANLENHRIPVIPIDAWRTDYLEDPLISFVAATEQRIAEERSRSETRIEKGKSIAIGLASSAGRLSPAISGLIADTFAPGSGEAAKAAAEGVEMSGKAVLDAIKTKKDAEIRFRELLSAARDHLTKRPAGRPVRPIVIALDELDRCRPSYAVKVLERIKHFFDVPGVIFVIATDGTNLPGAVSSVYGEKIDGEMYLRKFFDYEFDLSEPDSNYFSKTLESQFEFDHIIASSPYLADRERASQMVLTPSDHDYKEPVSNYDRGLDAFEILSSFQFFARHLKLSLRDQSQAFTLVNAYLRTLKSDVMVYPAVLSFIYCLRFSEPQTYEKIRTSQIRLKSIFLKDASRLSLVNDSESWVNATIYGLDLSFFWEASESTNHREYARKIRHTIFNESNASLARKCAIDKLFYRLHADKRPLTHFLPRAFQLADAFT
jgi:hypothetical protein